MDKIAKRSDRLAFFGVIENSETVYKRMRGFTELSIKKNPVEYSRRYIDEVSERNDVVGYSPAISYSFDEFSNDAVHMDIVKIADDELVGADAVRSIVLVDLASADGDGVCTAVMRNWSVIPDSEGDDTDAYTYSGTLKANGDITKGSAVSEDNWQSCTFTEI